MNIILNVRDTIVLCGSMFEYCPMQFFLNIFDCYCFKFSCGFLQNVPEIMSNTTGVTCGAGTAYPAEVLEFTTGFNGVPDVRYLVFCVVFCRSLFVFCLFSFDHCIFCSSSICAWNLTLSPYYWRFCGFRFDTFPLYFLWCCGWLMVFIWVIQFLCFFPSPYQKNLTTTMYMQLAYCWKWR